jgi:hypothetical protein
VKNGGAIPPPSILLRVVVLDELSTGTILPLPVRAYVLKHATKAMAKRKVKR